MKRILSLAFCLAFMLSSLSAQDFRNFRVPERIISPEMVGDTVVLRLAGEYATDVRVEKVILPLRDGLTVIRKRKNIQ